MTSEPTASLREQVARAVASAPVFDLHTHLFAPQFGAKNLWGIDELLTYHYLVAEALRADPKTGPEEFFARDKVAQADHVWRTLFYERSPLSEATGGVLTVLDAFGLDPHAPDLSEARSFYAARTAEQHIDDVLRLAGVDAVTMTNDPTDPAERAIWESGVEPDPRFRAALRLDRLVGTPDLRATLERWVARTRPRYLALSMEEVSAPSPEILRVCRDHSLPLALMIGVRRGVNPRLGAAGDGVSTVDLTALERLAARHADVRFLVTVLSRENVHGLNVVARKFANVLPFGCWWFLNNPSLVEEITLLRLEMLGPTFVPQHSDARVLDHLIYKWRHARTAIAAALTRRYEGLPHPPHSTQIERDANELLGGIARSWLS